MSSSLSAPKNPEFLVGTIAGLRLLSGEQQPRNQMEREILAELQSARINPDAAKSVVVEFDAKPQADRQRLLGRFADESVSLESLAASRHRVRVREGRGGASSGGNAASSASSSHAGGAAGNVGPMSEVATTGTSPGIRYTLRYKGLWCQEETTGPGSNEFYVITSGVAIVDHANRALETLSHPMGIQEDYYGDVDSLEERLGPVVVVYDGSPDTLSLAVTLMEHDYGDPNRYRDKIKATVHAAITVLGYFFPPALVLTYFEENIVDFINWIFGTGDDVISTEVMTWERPELEALAVQTPGFYQGWKLESIVGPRVNVPTGLLVHFVTKHHGDGGECEVGFDIERDPPRPDPVIL